MQPEHFRQKGMQQLVPQPWYHRQGGKWPAGCADTLCNGSSVCPALFVPAVCDGLSIVLKMSERCGANGVLS